MHTKRLYFAVILFPLSLIYGAVVFFRNLFFNLGIFSSVSFDLPVISVGNITAGGTGKTPHVEYLAGLLKSLYKIAVLSRGYKRKSVGFQLVVEGSTVANTGDELLQIRNQFPELIVAADRKRVHGIRQLTRQYPELDVIILDDGFQHRYVNPGLSILLVDHNRPVFRDFLLPLGNLRESRCNINRADMVIVTKCPLEMNEMQRQEFTGRLCLEHQQPVFFTCYQYEDPVPVFEGLSKAMPISHEKESNPAILMVAGIADTRPLKDYLSTCTTRLLTLTYNDHHAYNITNIRSIENRFNELPEDSKIIVTTAKDAVKFREMSVEWRNLSNSLYYLPLRVKFLGDGEKAFNETIMSFCGKQPVQNFRKIQSES
jgi:tetraacyldisaccharide 4'-kinase